MENKKVSKVCPIVDCRTELLTSLDSDRLEMHRTLKSRSLSPSSTLINKPTKNAQTGKQKETVAFISLFSADWETRRKSSNSIQQPTTH